MRAALARAVARLWAKLNSLPPAPRHKRKGALPPSAVVPLKPHRPRRKLNTRE